MRLRKLWWLARSALGEMRPKFGPVCGWIDDELLFLDLVALRLPPYVENGNLHGLCMKDVGRSLAALEAELKRRGLEYRVESFACRSMKSLGMMLCGRRRRVVNQRERVWRVYYGVEQALRRQRLSGTAARRLAGHLVPLLLLERPLLSVLRKVWRHADEYDEGVGWISPELRRELEVCKGLILVA